MFSCDFKFLPNQAVLVRNPVTHHYIVGNILQCIAETTFFKGNNIIIKKYNVQYVDKSESVATEIIEQSQLVAIERTFTKQNINGVGESAICPEGQSCAHASQNTNACAAIGAASTYQHK